MRVNLVKEVNRPRAPMRRITSVKAKWPDGCAPVVNVVTPVPNIMTASRRVSQMIVARLLQGIEVPERHKRPQDRSYGSMPSGPGDDPRYIAVSKGVSAGSDIPIPDPDPTWKPKARSWFNSLKLSGQSEFYEASDWATAVAAADAYNVFLRTYNASVFAQFVRLSERLGVTVTDRKKSRIELATPEPTDVDEDEADKAVLGWHGRLHSVE